MNDRKEYWHMLNLFAASRPIFGRLPGYLLLFGLCLTLLIGCAGVKVRTVSPAEQIVLRRGDILTSGKLSASSQEVLRVIGFDEKSCQKTLPECRETLTLADGLTQEQRLSTLAELWTQTALATEKQHKNTKTKEHTELVENWLETARYAYAYLFFTERKPGDRAFEDRQTQVRDYYNYATQQAITYAYRQHLSRGQVDMNARSATTMGNWQIQTDLSALSLAANTPPPVALIPAQSLVFSGIRNVYRRDGFGADLVAVLRRPDKKGDDGASKNKPYTETPFSAVTALIQYKGNTLEEVLSTRELNLVLFNPYHASSVTIARQKVPLSANFTASYGLWLARSNFATQAFRNLLGREGGITHARIYLMQPYDPNKKIIVMLHGLASSPEAWINLANEVLGDEKLRQNYQIWQVYYPTNAPLAINNKDIRQALEQTLKQFDPSGQAKASNEITLVGHSMGGVLSRLMVSTSDEQVIWDVFADKVSISTKEQNKIRSELSPYLDFKPLPQVRNIIFIATPHRGTSFANNRPARWIANLISLPPAMLSQLTNTTSQTPFHIPNSIDNLSDKDPFMQLTADLPINPKVSYHSIIGNFTPKVPLIDSTDGVVPYKSAHIDNACSELIVNSFHSVQEQPQAIIEIRRILKNQLNQNDCRKEN